MRCAVPACLFLDKRSDVRRYAAGPSLAQPQACPRRVPLQVVHCPASAGFACMPAAYKSWVAYSQLFPGGRSAKRVAVRRARSTQGSGGRHPQGASKLGWAWTWASGVHAWLHHMQSKRLYPVLGRSDAGLGAVSRRLGAARLRACIAAAWAAASRRLSGCGCLPT